MAVAQMIKTWTMLSDSLTWCPCHLNLKSPPKPISASGLWLFICVVYQLNVFKIFLVISGTVNIYPNLIGGGMWFSGLQCMINQSINYLNCLEYKWYPVLLHTSLCSHRATCSLDFNFHSRFGQPKKVWNQALLSLFSSHLLNPIATDFPRVRKSFKQCSHDSHLSGNPNN